MLLHRPETAEIETGSVELNLTAAKHHHGAALPFGVTLCVSVCLVGIFFLLKNDSNHSDQASLPSVSVNLPSVNYSSLVKNTAPISVPGVKAGEWNKIRWADNNQVIHDNTRVVGLPPHMTPTLKEYVDRVGLTALMKNLTGAYPLEPKTSMLVKLGGFTWFAQRPSRIWASNMHWISPADEKTHLEYLRLLGMAGFDTVLQGLANFDASITRLAAYQITFIAVSRATDIYFHKDVQQTRNKTFNVIIPITNAPNSGPELLLREVNYYRKGQRIGEFKYTTGEAAIALGDMASHSTSPIDYPKGELRVSATVFISDFDKATVGQLRHSLTQIFPHDDDFQAWALGQAGAHCCGENQRLPF
eukprot:gb/GEZN01011096.1/.p1 GENE.gb/GEZN01011096.1/~~gb/GEZN01011096.1/.p1  ORF type:complete len:360 (+),score=31.97 gb/GEZN01011096.1/:97-1176(+)